MLFTVAAGNPEGSLLERDADRIIPIPIDIRACDLKSIFSSLKTEHIARKNYRARGEAKADVFNYIECFYNPKCR